KLEIGSGSSIARMEEQLIERKAKYNKDVVVTIPEEYHAEELASKEATFKTEINEVKGKEVPELDDELAQELDESVKTVDEYKEKLRKDLEEAKVNQADATEKEEAITKASDNAT